MLWLLSAVKTSTCTPSVWDTQAAEPSLKSAAVVLSFQRLNSVRVYKPVWRKPTPRCPPFNTGWLVEPPSIFSLVPTGDCSLLTRPPQGTTWPVNGASFSHQKAILYRPMLTSSAVFLSGRPVTLLRCEIWCLMAPHRPTHKPCGLVRPQAFTSWT